MVTWILAPAKMTPSPVIIMGGKKNGFSLNAFRPTVLLSLNFWTTVIDIPDEFWTRLDNPIPAYIL